MKGEGEGEGAVFPKENLDLKVVKVWYQNGNCWFSYFADDGYKLCPELLLNDEDLIRVDTEEQRCGRVWYAKRSLAELSR